MNFIAALLQSCSWLICPQPVDPCEVREVTYERPRSQTICSLFRNIQQNSMSLSCTVGAPRGLSKESGLRGQMKYLLDKDRHATDHSFE